MQNEIDDQLKASNYHAAMRDMIDDGCKIGTGVCKGPVTGDKVRRGWKKQPAKRNPDGTTTGGDFALDVAEAIDVPAKRFNHYAENSTTRAFVSALARDIGIPISVRSEAGIPASELIQQVRGGLPHRQGTWVHPKVAIHLAQWLSPEFAVQVTTWVFDWLSGKEVHVREHTRRPPAPKLLPPETLDLRGLRIKSVDIQEETPWRIVVSGPSKAVLALTIAIHEQSNG